jgi:DNA-binding NarL/FixJ family response regulator
MNIPTPQQVKRFRRLFPSIPAETINVVSLYAAGLTQQEIAGLFSLSKSQVHNVLDSARRALGLHSVQTIRVVVNNRLYYAVLDLLDF